MRDVEIPNWLKGLPLAPEFHPTDTEFADPIAYISKIEKEASAFGICKVIPPFAKPSKKYVIANLNNSLSKCPELGSNVNLSGTSLSKMHNGDKVAVFTTRHQELGQSGKRIKGAIHNPQPLPVHKQVWQSGAVYTLEQFESKSKTFAKTHLGMVKEVSPLVIETLFWQVASEKPIYIEYANDVPGSGFAEPEGPLRKFHRRTRRRRTFSRNGPVDSNNNSNSDSPENSGVTTSSQNMLSNQTPRPSRQRNSSGGNEMMERNSSGWKLSNGPWNLQVIARAPGSLTRFMPDDIPGVTSPMVYIGMLFSWFAWHVEDHELHSLNFLHTGSQKTWYAVPGDYAFTFEETVRKKAYGGNIDRLAALTLLGEKTTLLSPEVIVASDIPCCRLVQNPGEFVVTFPRAYHVGFSHGFNCGEAANFGTPKWLTVAKEAAVRRAAMNYLPMLSHQQLLYLLTMSFISRVPRALLPGVRSSRLRDRQKEEREMLVKKAFIEDLLNENKLLSVLLRKNPAYHGVLWDLESLQSSIKESDLCSSSSIARIETTPIQKKNNYEHNDRKEDLYSEISMYMESMNNLYVEDEDDDLSFSFQVDTGTLPCVACGVLGFPFMSIVQPCEKPSKDLLHVDASSLTLEASDMAIPNGGASSLFLSGESSEDHWSQVPSGPHKEGWKWNTSTGYLRSHIFCLEHAIQIEELLNSKGGANVLLICHSDFQKIKAHAAAVAEEIGSSFNYKEIPLDEASKEELNLINLAIDNEDKEANDEDWTSELNINMRHRVKLRKVFPTNEKEQQHALTLCGLFSDPTPTTSTPSTLNWKSTKVRSKRNLIPPPPHDSSKPSESIMPPEDEQVLGAANLSRKKEDKIIQYSRRIKRRNGSAGASKDPASPRKLVPEESSAVCSADDPNENSRNTTEAACTGNYEMLDEHGGVVKTGDIAENSSVQSQVTDPVIAVNPVTEIEAQIGKDKLEETFIKDDDDNVCDESQLMHEVEVTEEIRENTDVCCSEISGGSPAQVKENIASDERKNQIAETSETSNPLATGDDFEGRSSSSSIQEANGDVSVAEVSDHANSTAGAVADAGVFDEKMEKSPVQGATESKNDNGNVSGDGTMVNETTTSVSVEENLEAHMDRDSDAADEMQSGGNKCCLGVECKTSSAASSRSKRKRQLELQTEDHQYGFDGFIKSPCEGLRPRARKDAATTRSGIDNNSKKTVEDKARKKKSKNRSDNKKEKTKGSGSSLSLSYSCNIEGCRVKFKTKEELGLHKKNRCPNEGCGKKFRSHKYAVLHLRVHEDDRPLKCPWKGCKMTFKWAWARTEHVRVHTGERPYSCKVEGCGLTFRFVSDYSRHRRKTGHYVNIPT